MASVISSDYELEFVFRFLVGARGLDRRQMCSSGTFSSAAESSDVARRNYSNFLHTSP
jgi:hypothetical protein